MRVTIPLLLILGVVIVAMARGRHKGDGLTLSEFVLCTVFGFLLASSSLASTIQTFIDAFGTAIARR